jgi:hypothetical protein
MPWKDATDRRLHYGAALVSFAAAFATYLLTMQPTVPFWDCGEFASAAWALQIPHPPGAPLWTLVGRIAMIVPTYGDIVARYNLLSVIASSITVLLLYLTLVKLIRLWRVDAGERTDTLITVGGAFIGALSFAWSDSFWFNAVECEVYAFGSLFIAGVLWLALLWHERADEKGSERYLLLIAYVIGLSMGVHQLALLTIFPVFMIVYYRRRDRVTLPSWIGMVALSVAVFLFTFVVLLTKLIAWAGNGWSVVSLGVVVLLMCGAYVGHQRKHASIALLSSGMLLIFLGYTTYTLVLVRSPQNPPMNQGMPSNLSRLASYINRDQYGDWKLFPRRLEDQKAGHPETWSDYSSDLSFFVKYQTNFMFHRYLAWNFIGRQDDDMGAGVDPLKTFGLSLLLGLFGLYWHFRRDPKRGLTLLAGFILLGYLTVWYQNQQEPQPRERDYFYVGAFYIYAMWIGIGASGVLEWIQHKVKPRENRVAIGASLLALVALVPMNQCLGLAGLTQGESFAQSAKWAEYSRRNNRVPWEYAYNILQSCESNAILFTYGDNDTFPLWCLQDVYGIRRDIRIVQLQLANAMTYCRALGRVNDWGGRPIHLTAYSDTVVQLPDSLAYPLIQRASPSIDMAITTDQAQWIMGSKNVAAVRFEWSPQIHLPSDLLVRDIISNNLTKRPVYYSVTVPETERAGLNPFLVYEGLVARVTPFKQPIDPSGIGASVQQDRFYATLFARPSEKARGPQRGMVLYSYSDPAANLSSMDKSYAMTYRLTFLRFADAMLATSNEQLAAATLDTMEARIPLSRVAVDYPYASLIADLAEKSADWPLAAMYARAGAESMREIMSHPDWRESDRYASETDPDILYADLLMRAGNFASAQSQFERLRAQSSGDRAELLTLKLEEVEGRRKFSDGDRPAGSALIMDVLKKYDPTNEHRGEFLELWNWIERPPTIRVGRGSADSKVP